MPWEFDMALLSRSDVKTYLGITGTGSDVRIDALIPAILAFIESYCGREFEESAITEYFHGPNSVFILSKFPILTIPALVLYDDWSRKWTADTLVDTDDYYVDYEGGIIYVDYNIGQGKMTIKANYTAGFGGTEKSSISFPADLGQACIELVARKLKEGEGALGVPTRAIPSGGTVAFGIDDILPQTKIVLDRYKR
jgi:hypothetical protein